jgi:hypothetical protein
MLRDLRSGWGGEPARIANIRTMTQQTDPDAELLLSKQRGILSPNQDDQSCDAPEDKSSGAEIFEEEFEGGHVGREGLGRSESD